MTVGHADAIATLQNSIRSRPPGSRTNAEAVGHPDLRNGLRPRRTPIELRSPERAELLAGPGTVGFRGVDSRNRHRIRLRRPASTTFDPDLTFEDIPVEQQRSHRMACEFDALAALAVGVETAPRASNALSSTVQADGRPSAATVA